MKGGYKTKDGFYIKDDCTHDCKNSEEEGMIDEDGYILDPILFERIPESEIVQLSDKYCYDKRNSKQLLNAVKHSKRLPFGHNVTSADKRKLKTHSSSSESLKSLTPISLSSFDPDEVLSQVLNQNLDRRSETPEIIVTSSPEEIINQVMQPLAVESPEEIEIIPRRTTRTRRSTNTSRTRRRRSRPTFIIESSSPEEIEIVPRRTRRRRLPQNAIILSDSTEVMPLPETRETSITSEEPSVASEEIVSERIPTPIPLIVQNGQPTYAPPQLNGYQAEWHPQTNSYILRRTGRGINIKHKSKNKKHKIRRKTRKNLR